MRQKVLDFVRRVAGTDKLHHELAGLRADVAGLAAATTHERPDLESKRRSAEAASKLGTLIALPGTDYSKYAIPVEYPPSRDLRPRWGNTQPLLQPIVDWIRPHEPAFRSLLDDIKRKAPSLAAITRDFDAANLPEPAWLGVPFAPFDSAALYTLVGQSKPALYLEIGSGVTTAFAHRSIRDHGLDTKIVSIDPEPRAEIDNICDEVVRHGLETCDLTLFDRLQVGDILFLDGSHRVFMNSDVTVFMLEVLPRLKPGVLVHIHDISLPWDYPDMFVSWYWSEQYILAAYIIGAADRLRPVFPTAWVCRDPVFEDWFAEPPVDLGEANHAWRGGGSLWFTHLE
ncbi:MAG: class I SAM-dependent methyltransferase [Geminicoccaceae bacterium]